MQETIPLNSIHTEDEAPINKGHFKMIITAGMGFFTDAYDLFIIGVVTAILSPLWHLSPYQIGLLNGASLLSAAFGAILFGALSDRFGRKKLYGSEIIIMVIGAIASACAGNFISLLIARTILGFGIGGDYPTSAVIAAEGANRKNRGFIVLLVFAMQALGLIVGPLIAALLLSLHIPHDMLWRIMLGLGAVFSFYVYFLRRKLKESKRFLALENTPIEVGCAASYYAGYRSKKNAHARRKSTLGKHYKKLIGTAGSWFCLDIALYGNGVSSMLILNTLAPHASIFKHTLTAMLVFIAFAAPGYALSACLVDKIGRKHLQTIGFMMMTLCYLSIACLSNIAAHPAIFTLLFGLSFLFINFGPNATTFLIPAEIFPTSIRASAHGFSAAMGKLGAFIGALSLPILSASLGMPFMFIIVALFCILGLACTFLIPEMKQQALKQT